MNHREGRRHFLAATALTGVGLAFSGKNPIMAAEPAKENKAEEADVNATEDLMREHGVLRRVLLIYREGEERLRAGRSIDAGVIASAAGIIRRFVEGYHEKLEEEIVFPRLVEAGKQTDLVRVLVQQHAAGRKLTAMILKDAVFDVLKDQAARQHLAQILRLFTRMYEPHAAREDTVLFPAFHSLFSEAEFDRLGDRFEEQEHKLLGGGSFEGTVSEVAQLEKALGIYDLASFTPSGKGAP